MKPEIVAVIDMLTLDNPFTKLKDVRAILLEEFNLVISISQISRMRRNVLQYRYKCVSHIARKRLTEEVLEQGLDRARWMRW